VETNDPHARRELEIFGGFASVCPLSILPESIEKRSPPEPDIRCSLADDRVLAFELVEIVDQDHSRRLANQIAVQLHFEKRFSILSADIDALNNLRNAAVDIRFTRESNDCQRKRAADDLLLALGKLPPDFSGDLSPADVCVSREQILRRVSIARGGFSGPLFSVANVGSFGDPVVERVRAKFEKKYATDAPVHLLAYYHRQPRPAEMRVLPELRSFIETNLAVSPFQRVWLYSHSYGSVVAIPEC
jgi:hypothetical protein